MYKNQKKLACSLECFSILLFCFCIFYLLFTLPCVHLDYSSPSVITNRFSCCCFFTFVLHCWSFLAPSALLLVVAHFGCYYFLSNLHYCKLLFALVSTTHYPPCIVTIHFLPSLLLFIIHLRCYYSLFTLIAIVCFVLLLFVLGCCFLPSITNVHSSFCVTTTCLGTHFTLPCVVACTPPCVTLTCSLPCVDPTTYWGVILPLLLAMCKLELRVRG
jgi:hypothetical protein